MHIHGIPQDDHGYKQPDGNNQQIVGPELFWGLLQRQVGEACGGHRQKKKEKKYFPDMKMQIKMKG